MPTTEATSLPSHLLATALALTYLWPRALSSDSAPRVAPRCSICGEQMMSLLTDIKRQHNATPVLARDEASAPAAACRSTNCHLPQIIAQNSGGSAVHAAPGTVSLGRINPSLPTPRCQFGRPIFSGASHLSRT
ncbi:hypothetical protein KC329_g49 [Hortaea werneckii]|nr:hypothetical protein KC329_g49 [Hortaea werneckii]